MKKSILILAMLAAATATASAAAAQPPLHQAGGPIRQGPYCWVATDARGSGWWDACGREDLQRGRSVRDRRSADMDAMANTSGGGGGGGGGGGR